MSVTKIYKTPINKRTWSLNYYYRHRTKILLKRRTSLQVKNSQHTYVLQHKDKIASQIRNHLQNLRNEINNKYGNKCNNPNCPIPPEKMDLRCLHIDHIKNNGSIERRQLGDSGNNRKFLKKVLADTKGEYQLLCVYCNWLKRYEKTQLKNRSEVLLKCS